MKAVFLADLGDASSSGAQRLWALRQCGVEVVVLDKQHYPTRLGRWAEYVAKLLGRPRLRLDAPRLERDLLATCQRERPDLVWLEWPQTLRPATLRQLRSASYHPYLIAFQDDNPWGTRDGDRWMWKDYLKLAPEVNLHLVKRASDTTHLRALGATAIRRWQHGVYDPLFHPGRQPKQYPVSFVGTAMENRGHFIAQLLDGGLDVHVFGTLWERRFPEVVRRYPANFHSPVRGTAYADVIRASQLSLLMVSDSNQDEWTMRSYEVPGCATAALACRTPTHEAMFEAGRTGYLYGDAAECLAVAKAALADPATTEAVGTRAAQEYQRRGWGLAQRMHELLAELAAEGRLPYAPIPVHARAVSE